jgi:DNA-binding beta-propeller fold protein YncE
MIKAVPVSTLAGSGITASGNGIGVQAHFDFPVGVAISRSGTFAVVADLYNCRIRVIDIATAQVTTLAGSGSNTFADGQGAQASFNFPEGVAISPDDSFVLVVEGHATSSHRLRHIVIATGVVTTLAGNGAGSTDGVGTSAKFNLPHCVTISPDGTYALIADARNFRVRRVDIASKTVTTVAGSTSGFADGTGTNARFEEMFQLAIDPTGAYALICDISNHRVRRLTIASRQVSTLAGSGTAGSQNGVGANAAFNAPRGVSIDPTGAYALIADTSNHRIRRIVIATAQVTTLAGTGAVSAVNGAGAQATFNSPHTISIDVSGTIALVADYSNHRVRRIALSSPPCSPGYYCPAGSSSPTQVACAPGYYCASGAVFTVQGAMDGQGIDAFCIVVFHMTVADIYCPYFLVLS